MKHLIDSVLVKDTVKLVAIEKRTTAEVLRHIEEIDRRQLFVEHGCSSMIQFCIRVLGYSEGASYRRLQSARLVRALPETLPLLASGQLTLTNAAKAQEFMKAEGVRDLGKKKDVVSLVLGRTGREAEEILKSKSKPDSSFRRKSILRRATATDWDFSVTISTPLKDKLEKIRNLKSHSIKSWEDVLEVMADATLKELTKVRSPRATATPSRSPTPAMKNALLRSAGHKCQAKGCSAEAFLQVDHVIPVAMGGRTEMGNLMVLCAAHNRRKG